ncbi:MAG: trypsin-like peptidase domain-containing protein [Planctomycetes bacterium]|nr:trypsin-like peptidase domain-containing protein [Planctomycetota bacterium]
MAFTRRTAVLAAVLGLLQATTVPAAAPATPAAPVDGAKVDALALRKAAEPKVCLVTVDGPLGLPLARASGLLVGDGKLVVTDLATLAQPGIQKVRLRFGDGRTAEAKTFAVADPALGLVVLRIEKPDPKFKGYGFSKAAVPEKGMTAVAIGWKWGESLDLSVGTVLPGPATADVAKDAEVTDPPAAARFDAFWCTQMCVAPGAPVLTASGEVAGVVVRFIGCHKMLSVPAAEVAKLVASAATTEKAVTLVPNAVWPGAVEVIPGRPTSRSEFAEAVRLVKRRSICTKCKGKTTVRIRKLVGYTKNSAGIRVPLYREEDEPCDKCMQEGIVFDDKLYNEFATMAEGATWRISDDSIPENERVAAFNGGMGLLAALAKVGSLYQTALIRNCRRDVDAPGRSYPRGFIGYAQVCETIEMAGCQFTIVVPQGSAALLMVDASTLVAEYSLGEPDQVQVPGNGDWVVLGGIMEGPAKLEGFEPADVRPIFLRLYGWMPGPMLGMGVQRTALARAGEKYAVTGTETDPSTGTVADGTPPKRRPSLPRRPRSTGSGAISFFGLGL